MEKPKKFSIDIAIDACIEKVTEHQKKANRFLGSIIVVLFLFTTFFLLQSVLIASNQSKLVFFKSDILGGANKLSKILPSSIAFYSELRTAINDFKDTTAFKDYQLKLNHIYLQSDSKIRQISDSLFLQDSIHTEIISNLKAILDKADTNLYTTIDHTATYIFYGVFILVFGIPTSFYRHYIKEISKYEHYRIAFERIRIAGYNATTKYDGEVLRALTSDVFIFDTRISAYSKSKNIESPIPGSDFRLTNNYVQ